MEPHVALRDECKTNGARMEAIKDRVTLRWCMCCEARATKTEVLSSEQVRVSQRQPFFWGAPPSDYRLILTERLLEKTFGGDGQDYVMWIPREACHDLCDSVVNTQRL